MAWSMMTTMAARSNVLIAVVVSSALFSLFHLFNDNVSLLAMANIFLVGLFLAVYALWEKGLWGIAGIHTSWNMAQANFFGLEVSGNDLSFGSLLDLEENGPGLWTGDAFGPEAGLVATLVVGAGLAIVAWLRRLAANSGDTTL